MLAQNLGLGGGGAMFCPVISPDNPNLLFVSCDLTGLYRSTDGGQNWVLLDGRVVQGSSRFSVAFDPSRTGHVIAYHPAQGLKESMDGGVSWTPFSPALPQYYDPAQADPLVVTAAAFSPETSPRLLIGTTKGV